MVTGVWNLHVMYCNYSIDWCYGFDGMYEAVRDGEIVTYSKCYKEHGHNVCEGAFNNKEIVEDYWKK